MDLADIQTLVRNIASKNMIDADTAFDNVMSVKVGDALNSKRQEVAAAVYGPAEYNPPTEVDSVIDSDDDLDDDTEGDEE